MIACPVSSSQDGLYMTLQSGVSKVITSEDELNILQRGRNDIIYFTKVSCKPLSLIFEENKITWIDFFSLDVEGSELTVLESIDWGKVHIEVLIVETGKHKEGGLLNSLVDKDAAVEKLLIEKAGMVKLATLGSEVPKCQIMLKKMKPGYVLHE